jgi:hypothetical protein
LSSLSVFFLSYWITNDETSSSHSKVIFDETHEWDIPPIFDILATTDAKCPQGYETVVASFPGTKNICMSRSSGYRVGQCSRGSDSNRVEPTLMEIFEGNHICYKRGNDTYH